MGHNIFENNILLFKLYVVYNADTPTWHHTKDNWD
jgi:hypothetical protein